MTKKNSQETHACSEHSKFLDTSSDIKWKFTGAIVESNNKNNESAKFVNSTTTVPILFIEHFFFQILVSSCIITENVTIAC